MELLLRFTRNTWALIAEMGPYLLLGFALAGLLHVLIRPEKVKQVLGQPSLATILKACLIGVPMPLCSCSVIPVAAGLHKNGASRGATAAFLSSTPQTGVDSIFATYSLLGGAFTLIRVIVAFISGITAGLLIERFCPPQSKEHKQKQTETNCGGSSPEPTTNTCCSSEADASSCHNPAHKHPQTEHRWYQALHYGFVTLPADLAKALLIGLLLAGLITTLLPANLFSGIFSSGPLAFLLATAISLPLYVCATASIPMAYALMAAGLSPGAALIFLITGPATNTTTITTILSMLGRKATAIYLASLLVISWLAGWLCNATLPSHTSSPLAHTHESSLSLWQHASGILLLLILAYSLIHHRRSRQ